jgi:hypothetical protein
MPCCTVRFCAQSCQSCSILLAVYTPMLHSGFGNSILLIHIPMLHGRICAQSCSILLTSAQSCSLLLTVYTRLHSVCAHSCSILLMPVCTVVLCFSLLSSILLQYPCCCGESVLNPAHSCSLYNAMLHSGLCSILLSLLNPAHAAGICAQSCSIHQSAHLLYTHPAQ